MKAYLPIPKELKRWPRDVILNIIYTKVGKPFKDWVDAKVQERNESKLAKEDNDIAMNSELIKLYFQSNHKSSKCIPRHINGKFKF